MHKGLRIMQTDIIAINVNSTIRTGSRFLIYVIIFLLSIIIQSCSIHSSKIIVEKDVVKSTSRIRKDFYYHKTDEKNTPFSYLNQIILKESKIDNKIAIYTVYENLALYAKSYKLENTIFIILGQEIIPIEINALELVNSTQLSEESDNLLTADSTNISVVTGYTQSNKRNYKYSYNLSLETINKILISNQVKFRYYAGPNMMTTTLKRGELKDLKKIISMN